MNLDTFRSAYPQYDDLSDQDLAQGLHARHYSDIPFEDFAKQIGYTPPPAPSPNASDYAKSLASGAVSGAGAIFQGGGELAARGANAALGTDLRAINPLQGAIDWLENSKSAGAKRAIADSQITGDITDPSSWDAGKNPTLHGLALQGINAIGQFAPNLAIALATGGVSVPAQLGIGATVGGLQGLGAGAEEERGRFLKMTPDELNKSSGLYRELIGRGIDTAVARAAVAEAAALGGGLGNAIPSAAEGAFENFLIGALAKGKWRVPALLGRGTAGRVATGAAGGALTGGIEEAGEQAAQNLGSNLAVGGNRPLGEGTLQQFVMGMIAEGTFGGAAGFAGKPAEAAPPATAPSEQPQPEPVRVPDELRLEEHHEVIARIGPIMQASTVEDAIGAAEAAVEFKAPTLSDLAEVRAESLALAPLDEQVAAEPGLEFHPQDPIARAAAVEIAEREQEVKAMEEAARLPYEPTPVPAPGLALAPTEPAATSPSLDIAPFLQERQLARAAPLEAAQAQPAVATPAVATAAPAAPPAFIDFPAPKNIPARGIKKGATLSFKTERGAATYAKSNALEGFAPRQVGRAWVLSKPRPSLELAPLPAGTDALAPAAPPTQVTHRAEPAPAPQEPGAQAEEPQALPVEPALDTPPASPAERLQQVAGEIGWAEHGGRMIRAPSPDGMGEVTGRTPWVAKSDFWPGRPKDITPKIAHAALEKVAAGEPLRKAEQRFVDYANEWLDRQEAAPAPQERTVERRRDDSQRLRVAEMNAEEMRQALLTDELTGLGNRRAFQESTGRTWRAAVDADSLKFINDNFGHAAGDQMLARIGEAFRDEGVDAYHVSGDEFVALFDTEAEAYNVMGRVKARLAQVKITATGPDGNTITKTGVDFSYGLGQDDASAEVGLQRDKAEREDSGLRAARGEEPPGVVRGPAVQAGEGGGRTAPAEVATPEPEPGPASAAKPTETPAQAGVSASAPALDLTGETEAEIRNREAGERKAAGEKASQESAPAPEDFTLTGSESPADQARARGQMELAPPAESAPAVADVPPGLLKRITVTVEQYHEGEGVKSVQVSADKALADVQEEIDAYEALLKCVKGAA